jgi:hypothetical protein
VQVRSTDATGEREAKALSFKWLVGVCFNLPPSFAVPPPVVERSDAAAPDGTAERESGDSGSSAGAEAEEEDVLEEEDRLAAAVFEAMKPKQHEDLVASPTRYVFPCCSLVRKKIGYRSVDGSAEGRGVGWCAGPKRSSGVGGTCATASIAGHVSSTQGASQAPTLSTMCPVAKLLILLNHSSQTWYVS